MITPHDLLRWVERDSSSKTDLAIEGYMLLAERFRSEDEKELVCETIETELKVKIDCESLYYGPISNVREELNKLSKSSIDYESTGLTVQEIASTKSSLRLLTFSALNALNNLRLFFSNIA